MDWAATIGLILTGVGLIGTTIGLYQARKQMEQSQRIALGEFLLNLDNKFSQHQETHLALRPGGKWAANDAGPTTPSEWADVEIYMGLFERINILIEKEILDKDTVRKLYGYRVRNIVANKTIRDVKLKREARSWQDFIRLCESLDIVID